MKLPKLPEISAGQELLDKVSRSLPDLSSAPAPKPATVYRWRDEQGTVHYSDRPNPKGGSERIVANPQTNLVPAKKEATAAAAKTGEETADSDSSGLSLPLPTSIPITEVPKLIDDARELQQFSQLRELQRQELSDN